MDENSRKDVWDKLQKNLMSGFFRGTIFGLSYNLIFGAYHYGSQGLPARQIASKILRKAPIPMFFFGLYMGSANFFYHLFQEHKYNKTVSIGGAVGVSYLLISMTERYWLIR